MHFGRVPLLQQTSQDWDLHGEFNGLEQHLAAESKRKS